MCRPRLDLVGVHGRSVRVYLPGLTAAISHKVFIQSFCKSQFPHKSANSFFSLVMVKDMLTDLWVVDFCKTTLKILCVR
jgi:hypothetical protein